MSVQSNTISIVGKDKNLENNYIIEVTGDISQTDNTGRQDATWGNGIATGWVVRGKDTYVFTGDVKRVELENKESADVLINGEKVPLNQINQGGMNTGLILGAAAIGGLGLFLLNN